MTSDEPIPLTFLYQLAILGAPTTTQVEELRQEVSTLIEPFGLSLGEQVEWVVAPMQFMPDPQKGAAAAFFGSLDAPLGNLPSLLLKAVPVLPIVSTPSAINHELPALLMPFSCLFYDVVGAKRTATALLECAGLLPRQRRVFLSYRRDEARQAALQLFDAFSSRLFDVFLDTHAIAPAEDFQTALWHHLCDSDVLVMLDTPGYFASRWTDAEYGRALAKSISVLRVEWPDCTPSVRTATASRAELLPEEVDASTGRLSEDAVKRICMQLESVRSLSHAVRHLNLVSNLRHAVEQIGGTVSGVGLSKAVYIRLPNGLNLVAFPTVGVPTSRTFHEAAIGTTDTPAAVVYDHVGLHPRWLEHLDWLGAEIRSVRLIRASQAAWDFAGWVVK